MYYIHECTDFIVGVKDFPNQKEIIYSKINQIKHRDTLKGIKGAVDAYPGGISVINVLGALTCRTIVQEIDLSIADDLVKVLFIRQFIPKSSFDYFWPKTKKQIAESKDWLEFNPLPHAEIDSFKSNFLKQQKYKDEKPELPTELATWTNDFKIDLDFEIYEEEKWVNYTFNVNPQDGLSDLYIELFRIALKSLIIEEDTNNLKIQNINTKLNIFSCEHAENSVGIIFIKPKNIENLYIICDGAHTQTQAERWNKIKKEAAIREEADYENLEKIALNTLRAYPKIVLKNPELWYAILQRRGHQSNFSLMPEQLEFLEKFNFPTYINGQAGSGKSTMLCYLFAHAYYLKCLDILPGEIIFITENETLLGFTEAYVRDLLSYNSAFEGIPIEKRIQLSGFFKPFKSFLLEIVGSDFEITKYLNFKEFKNQYQKSNLSNTIKSKYSAELSWFVITTYIRGYDLNHETNTIDNYKIIPSKYRTVSSESFSDIYNYVFPFFKQLISDGFWDKITLIKHIHNEKIEISRKFTLIICDEAQDFSKVELDFILSLSIYKDYIPKANIHAQFPVVFAGDALQTVSPTGFRTDILNSMFHDALEKAGYKNNREKIVFTPKYNYRSSKLIVNLANLIQAFRYKVLKAEKVDPQLAKRQIFLGKNSYNIYSYESLETPNLHTQFNKYFKHKVFIIPVDVDEEEEYKERIPLIKDFTSVKSAVEAKGVEYPQVVVWGFGENYINKFDSLSWDKILEESLFEHQFFFNKLYVAITRAQNEIIIIDSKLAIENFWKPLLSYDSLVIECVNWEPDSMTSVIESRPEDARINANRDKEQGLIDKNPSRLKIASDTFINIGDELAGYECLAWSEKFKGHLNQAAIYFEKAQNIEEAAKCLWLDKQWDGYRKLAYQLEGKNIEASTIIAKFMQNKVLEERDIRTAYALRETINRVLRDVNWRDEFCLNLISYAESSKLHNDDIRDLIAILEALANDDYEIWTFIGLLYYQTAQYEKAIDTWDKDPDEKSQKTTEYIKSSINLAVYSHDKEKEIVFRGRLAGVSKDSNEINKEFGTLIRIFNENKSDFIYKNTFEEIISHVYRAQILNSDKNNFIENARLFEEKVSIENCIDFYDKILKCDLSEELSFYVQERKVKKMHEKHLKENTNLNAKDDLHNSLWLTELNEALEPGIKKWSLKEIEQISEYPMAIPKEPSGHFSAFSITNFRRFSNLEIVDIGLFNLILGDNNVGKTTLLEALLFTSNPNQFLFRTIYVDSCRKNSLQNLDIESPISNICKNWPTEKTICIKLGEKRRKWSFEVTVPTIEEIIDIFELHNLDNNEYIKITTPNSLTTKDNINNLAISILLKKIDNPEDIGKVPFIPFGKGYGADLANLYYHNIESNHDRSIRQGFITSLKSFIPNVKSISADTKMGYINIIEQVSDIETISPLHYFGEGANKLFRILLYIALNKNGKLMIDEIDAGIHFSRFKKFWLTILNAAYESNVQIFATTHNMECIEYFTEILKEHMVYQEHSRVITLENIEKSNIIAYSRSHNEFQHAIDFGRNLRGG